MSVSIKRREAFTSDFEMPGKALKRDMSETYGMMKN